MPHAAHEAEFGPERLSLAEAARLTGLPKVYPRELAESGRLAVYLVPDRNAPKPRVTRSGLIEAGLLADESAEDGDRCGIVALIRARCARIATLEEQRTQLGAQLGATRERIGAVPAGDAPDSKTDAGDALGPAITVLRATGVAPSPNGIAGIQVRDAALRLGEARPHRSAGAAVRLMRRPPLRRRPGAQGRGEAPAELVGRRTFPCLMG